MRRVLKWLAIGLVVLLVLATLGFLGWTRIARYPAFDSASTLAAEAEVERGWYVFEPADDPIAGFIFYPGGLVDPAAYAPLMQRLADAGVLAVVVPMPLDLAVFDSGAAGDVIDAYPAIDRWVIGGHSLGGAMAAEFASAHPEAIDGLVFLASYPAESTDLSTLDVPVLSIYGTEDGVAGDVFADSLERLPAATELLVLEGGNHAQFGDYGPQEGDGEATMSREEQQQRTAEAIVGLAETIAEAR